MRSLRQDESSREEFKLGLNKIACHGVRKMLAEVLEAGVQAYFEAARGEPTMKSMPQSRETAAPRSERSFVELGLWKSKLPGSTKGGWTRPATGRDSRA